VNKHHDGPRGRCRLGGPDVHGQTVFIADELAAAEKLVFELGTGGTKGVCQQRVRPRLRRHRTRPSKRSHGRRGVGDAEVANQVAEVDADNRSVCRLDGRSLSQGRLDPENQKESDEKAERAGASTVGHGLALRGSLRVPER
jgi:hypothetical protein